MGSSYEGIAQDLYGLTGGILRIDGGESMQKAHLRSSCCTLRKRHKRTFSKPKEASWTPAPAELPLFSGSCPNKLDRPGRVMVCFRGRDGRAANLD